MENKCLKEMCSLAAKNNRNSIDNGLIEIYQESTPNLHFEDNYFDYVLLTNVIYFWKDIKPHLQEIHRITRKGGVIVIFMRSRKTMLVRIPEEDGIFNLHRRNYVESTLEEIGFQILESEKDKEVISDFDQRYGFIISAIKT